MGRFERGIRGRVVVWYVLLMMLSAAISVPAIRHLLLDNLDRRTEKYLSNQVAEFRRVVRSRDPKTGQLHNNDAGKIFNAFLFHELPRDDTFFIALSGDRLYKSSSQTLSRLLAADPEWLRHWAIVSRSEKGKINALGGSIFYYVAEPIALSPDKQIVLVAVQNTTGARAEIDRAIAVVGKVALSSTAIAAILTWLMAGRILRPLNFLTRTARSIGERDLTKRIPARGRDEIAELTHTFNSMLDRLHSAFTSQKEFMNEIGHELRTPIAILRVNLELLGNDPEESKQTVALLTDELDRMSRLVNDLILLAKAEQPDFLNLKVIEVDALTQDLYAKARSLAERDWQLELGNSGKIVADRQRLAQAIVNLITNAIQHTKQGDRIVLGSAVEKGYARFLVGDSGSGIAPEAQQLVFHRFVRFTSGSSRSEGMGLGLAIARTIAEAHGGWIELSSQVGEGSTFTIVVPVDSPRS